jgi:large subunit ribosomal protein L25
MGGAVLGLTALASVVGEIDPARRAELAAYWLQSAAVAGERVKLPVSERPVLGSAESRRLRSRGLIPGVLYGREQPVAIAIPERDLRAALTGAGGTHAVLDVVVDGGKVHSSVLKEYQQDPVRGRITHVDLQEVRLDQPIQTALTVTLVGEPAGAKEGGVLSQVTNEVNVEALPLEIPEHLEVDVSEMHIGDTLRLNELTVPQGVTLLDDPEGTVLATVTMPTRVEEPEEVLAEGEEGELEGVPAEQRPEGGAEGAAEPGAAAAGGEGTVGG